MSATVIAGVSARADVTPADRAELAAAVRELYANGAAFAFAGGGTELDLGDPPRALDTVVRTARLDRVLDYAPEDQTITVEGGMPFAALDAVLAEHGQWLPLDVPDRGRSTVGGAIATNAFGPLRHRYGSLKDLIVGVEIVRPDGTRARGGGKVVKNVAGFDLPKLMVGSLGTLGAIASATLRVFPRPAAARSVLVLAAPDGPFFDALQNDRSLEPVAVVHFPARGVLCSFDGIAPAVDDQCARVRALAAEHGSEAQALAPEAVDYFAQTERAVRTEGAWRWTRRTHPVRAREPVERSLGDVRAAAYPTLGVTRFAADDDPRMELRGSDIVFHAMPQHARGRIGAWGTPPPSFPIMRALKANFDPKGLCNPGRFVGGL